MVVKDPDTLMRLVVRGKDVTMSQGDFVATGTREDAVYSLKGVSGGKEYRLRLYTLGDRYAFQRETWADGKILEIDMSYLTRR